jgi:hypothetical protein
MNNEAVIRHINRDELPQLLDLSYRRGSFALAFNYRETIAQ